MINSETSGTVLPNHAIQKGIPLFIIILVLLPAFAFGQSFNHKLYSIASSEYGVFLKAQLSELYHTDESTRDQQFEALIKAARNSIKEGDSLFVYQILTDFIMNNGASLETGPDEKDLPDIKELQEQALEFLIDRAEEDDISLSNREFLIKCLSTIAPIETIHDFDLNEQIIESLLQLTEEDDLIIKQTALTGLKSIVLKSGDRWDSLRKSAAKAAIRGLDSGNTEISQFYLTLAFDILTNATELNDGTVLVWEELNSVIEDIESPALITSTKAKGETLIKIHSGSLFKKYINETRNEIDDLEINQRRVKDSVSELIEVLLESNDPVDLEEALHTLLIETTKDRAILNTVYAKISGITLSSNISEYKLRLVNQALIEITNTANSSLYFFRTAMAFLGEISVYRNSHKASIPVEMLAELLATTDYEGLTIPTIKEISISLNSDLPIWIGNRLIGLIFIQANESPNENVALFSVKSIAEISQTAKNAALRWEAAKRIQTLANSAKMASVRDYALNWK